MHHNNISYASRQELNIVEKQVVALLRLTTEWECLDAIKFIHYVCLSDVTHAFLSTRYSSNYSIIPHHQCSTKAPDHWEITFVIDLEKTTEVLWGRWWVECKSNGGSSVQDYTRNNLVGKHESLKLGWHNVAYWKSVFGILILKLLIRTHPFKLKMNEECSFMWLVLDRVWTSHVAELIGT